MSELKTMDISWRLDYSYTDFVTDNIFVELDKSIETLSAQQAKFALIDSKLKDCFGTQITKIYDDISNINSYLGSLKQKFEDKKKEVQKMANIFQAKFDKEIKWDDENFPGNCGTYLYYRYTSGSQRVEISADTEVGGPDDKNRYAIYYISKSTCVRNIHGAIERDLRVTSHIFSGKTIDEPMKIRYKGTFPSHEKKRFVHYYNYKNGSWEEINIRNLINHME